ncbi:MAG: NAD-dependent epimerase/dehydratase family protein [Desulfobacterales bacterium]|nr:NAD-dependent epimerase/dehydratase family protein [Desulfobacterales bacterium]
MFFKGKKVLVAGGTGMIGIPLVKRLIEQGASVRIASLDDPSRAHSEAEFIKTDLMRLENCSAVCKGMEFVFNLLGVKGSPAVTTARPASFLYPPVMMEMNMLEAARQANVTGYLFTSSIGVYAPAEVFREDDVWKTFPSPNDWFSGWAKRMGELQVDAYKIEYKWNQIAIVRPANTYGPFDNFDSKNAMVIPSLIKRSLSGENPLRVWGDGTPVRDFIYADDVARGMLLVAEKMPGNPVNLGSGTGVSIKELVEAIASNLEKKPEIFWDTSAPEGDKKRIMDISRAKSIGFEPEISLEKGVKKVMEWYKNQRGDSDRRYDVFD